MTTTMAPPPPPPAPPAEGPRPEPAPTPPTRGSSRVVAILAIVFGGLVVLGALGWAVVSTIVNANVRTEVRSVPVSGVDSLDLDLSAGNLRVEFADVSEARLEVRGAFGIDRWTFRAEDDDLVVASPHWMFGAGWLFGGNGEAVLTLPDSLEGMDADLNLSAGDLDVEGTFGEIEQTVSAGSLTLQGTARSLDLDLSAGDAEVDMEDLGSGEWTISAGSLDARLIGEAPRELTIDLSAGSADVVVPTGSYDITSDVSAGSFDNFLGSDPGAANRIAVQVSAGEVVLRTVRD